MWAEIKIISELSQLESLTFLLKHSSYYQYEHLLKIVETGRRKIPDFWFVFLVTPQKMCQCLRTQWKDREAVSEPGSDRVAQVVNMLSSAQCFSYSHSRSSSVHDTTHMGAEITGARKREQAKARQGLMHRRKCRVCIGVPILPAFQPMHKTQEINQTKDQFLSTCHSQSLCVHPLPWVLQECVHLFEH